MANAASPIPKGLHTVTPHLMLDNASQTMEWYKKAFGAEEIGRHPGPDGKIMHAEMKIGDSHIYMNDVMQGAKGARELGGSPVALWLYVENADAVYNRAIEAGARVQMPLDNQFWGDRGGAVIDPEGFTWWIATRKEDLTPAELEERAQEFFKQMAQPAAH